MSLHNMYSQDRFLIFSLFISARKMALEQNDRDLKNEDAQFKEMFLNLSKRQEELKALLAGNTAKKHPNKTKDDQVAQLQVEMEAM